MKIPILFHGNDVPWYDAPVPHRWHSCRPQTWGAVDGVNVRRCACGAISMDGSHWMERNSRKKES